MNMTLSHWAIIGLTIVLTTAGILYFTYLIKALNKDLIKSITPVDKTYRLAFFLVIIIAIAYLALGLGEGLSEGVITLLGTVAGYLLGGVPARQSTN